MQARYIETSDKADLYAFVNTVSKKDSRAIDYFFKELFNNELIILEKDNMIKCLISFESRILHLSGHKIAVAYINDILIDPSIDQEEAISRVLAILAEKYLMTISDLDNLGDAFIQVENKIIYEIYRKQLFNINGYYISDEFLEDELQSTYDKYISKFNIYLQAKDDRCISDLLEDYELFVCRDRDDLIKGYIVYNYIDGIMHVKSIAYSDSLSLLTLLNQAMGMNDRIVIEASLFENYELVIDKLQGHIKAYTSICVNDESLFKRLFNNKYSSINEMLNAAGKTYYFL